MILPNIARWGFKFVSQPRSFRIALQRQGKPHTPKVVTCKLRAFSRFHLENAGLAWTPVQVQRILARL